MNTVIRPLAVEDVPRLQQIDRSAHGQAWSRETFLEEIERDDRIHLVRVDPGGELIAHSSAWLDGSCGRITNVAVDAAQQGKGHASALLVALLHTLLGRPACRKFSLEVRADNMTAQSLYRRFGFAPVGVRRNFYPKSASSSRDALVMEVQDPHGAPWRTRFANHQRDSDSGAAA